MGLPRLVNVNLSEESNCNNVQLAKSLQENSFAHPSGLEGDLFCFNNLKKCTQFYFYLKSYTLSFFHGTIHGTWDKRPFMVAVDFQTMQCNFLTPGMGSHATTLSWTAPTITLTHQDTETATQNNEIASVSSFLHPAQFRTSPEQPNKPGPPAPPQQ